MSDFFNPETGEVGNYAEGCPHCKEHIRERIEAEAKVLAVQQELIRVLRQNTKLRNELAQQLTEGPESGAAKALGGYWIARSGRNPKRTKIGEKRLKAVVGRLRDNFSPTYIAHAVDAVCEYGWVDARGIRHDDLELVCRDEVKLEQYFALWERMHPATLVGPAWIREWGDIDNESRKTKLASDVPL